MDKVAASDHTAIKKGGGYSGKDSVHPNQTNSNENAFGQETFAAQTAVLIVVREDAIREKVGLEGIRGNSPLDVETLSRWELRSPTEVMLDLEANTGRGENQRLRKPSVLSWPIF